MYRGLERIGWRKNLGDVDENRQNAVPADVCRSVPSTASHRYDTLSNEISAMQIHILPNRLQCSI